MFWKVLEYLLSYSLSHSTEFGHFWGGLITPIAKKTILLDLPGNLDKTGCVM